MENYDIDDINNSNTINLIKAGTKTQLVNKQDASKIII